jgi:hypothetical protein
MQNMNLLEIPTPIFGDVKEVKSQYIGNKRYLQPLEKIAV